MSDHLSTQQLIQQIEKKDRRFRTAQSIFMALLMITLIFLVSLVFRTLDSVKQQLEGQKNIVAQFKEEEEAQLQKITRRLDCMVVFFSTPDRQNLTIEDIERCSLNRDENVDQFFEQPESTPSEQPPNLDDSSSTATQENAEEQRTAPNQSSPEPPTEEPPVVEPRPPVEILGIPVCIPLTDICVRQ